MRIHKGASASQGRFQSHGRGDRHRRIRHRLCRDFAATCLADANELARPYQSVAIDSIDHSALLAHATLGNLRVGLSRLCNCMHLSACSTTNLSLHVSKQRAQSLRRHHTQDLQEFCLANACMIPSTLLLLSCEVMVAFTGSL